MKKMSAIILVAFILLSGCRKETLAFPGEDNIQPYIQKVLELGEVPNFDYSLSVEDFFITASKSILFDADIKYFKQSMSDEGLLADENCTIYLPIGFLAGYCDGKTRLYIDGELKYEFNSENKNGKSYMLLSEELTKRVMDYIMKPGWSPDSIRGKKIYTHFYMTKEDWANAVVDKDPFKYLCLDVYIKDAE